MVLFSCLLFEPPSFRQLRNTSVEMLQGSKSVSSAHFFSRSKLSLFQSRISLQKASVKVSIKLGFCCSFRESNAPNFLECRGEGQLGREIGRTKDELRAHLGRV